METSGLNTKCTDINAKTRHY